MFKVHKVGGYDTMVWSSFESVEGPVSWGWFTSEHLRALLQLLDILVLYDDVAHDKARAYVWEDSAAFSGIASILRPVEVPTELPTALSEFLRQERQLASSELLPFPLFAAGPESSGYEGRDLGIVEDPFWEHPKEIGSNEMSLFYLALAVRSRSTYWPAPRRAEYLRACLADVSITKDVGASIQEALQDAMAEMAERLVRSSSNLLTLPALSLPGLGSVVLGQCESPRSIISTALEVRSSRPASAFREWLTDYSNAIESGNLLDAAQKIRRVQDVLKEFQRELGLDGPTETQLELQVGLTPSVSVSASTLGAFFQKVMPTARHLLFVRNYMKQSLSATDVTQHIRRLFPGLPLLETSPR